MGAQESKKAKNNQNYAKQNKHGNNSQILDNLILIKCYYKIKDINDEVQIMNYRGKTEINEEIEKKIKILNEY